MDALTIFKPLLPLIALLGGAVGAVVGAAYARGRRVLVEQASLTAGLALAFALAWRLWPAMPHQVVATLALDRLAIAGLMIVVIAVGFATMLWAPYLEARGEQRVGAYGLVALAALGMALLCTAADLVTMLVALEATALPLYALAGFFRDRPASLEGALKYFMMGAFATAFFCMGLAFLFGSMGTTSLPQIAERAAYVAGGEGAGLFFFGMAMLVAGLSFKVAVVPFHAWAPDAYEGSPTPVTLLIATAAKAAAFVALVRIATAVAVPGGMAWHHLAWGLSVASIVWGNVAALRQQNLKRLLAYSSIAHAGYLFVAFPLIAKAPGPMERALLLAVIALVLSNTGAFAAVVAVGLAPGEPVEMRHLAGLSRRRPWLAAAFALFLLSLAGVPPTIGFFGKYYLFLAAVRAGDVALVVIALLGTVISLYYYLAPIVVMYFRDAPPPDPGAAEAPVLPASHVAVVAVLALAALAVLFFGLFPQNLVAFVEASAF
jgi:NADH-quinone oxidoreductase subunit N